METFRQQDTVLSMKSKQIISILDFGIQAKDMLEKWKLLQDNGIYVTLKEFPTIDFYQTIDDKPLMELILEFAMLTEQNKKLLAKQKQAEGIEKARKRGIKLGRREKEIPANFANIYERVITKKISIKKATEILNVDYKTYRKWIKQYKG